MPCYNGDMDNNLLRIEYIPLDVALLWENNLKRHDIGALIQSFEKHGFKDAPKFEPTLNGGDGGIVEGNGRFMALDAMRRQAMDPPRGIAVLDDGTWAVPVTFGVDANSEAAAEAYGIDHNLLTMSGGDFDISDMLRLYDDGLDKHLLELAQAEEVPVVFDGDDIDALLGMLDSEPVDAQLADQVNIEDMWIIIVDGKTEQRQLELLEEFLERGLDCRTLVS